MASAHSCASFLEVPVGGRAGKMVTKHSAHRYKHDQQLMWCCVSKIAGACIEWIDNIQDTLLRVCMYEMCLLFDVINCFAYILMKW